MLEEGLQIQISQEIKDEVQIQLELDKLLDQIKKCIFDKNDWIERNEICETLQLSKNTRLIDGRPNSKMGQLLYYYIRKMGFDYRKVELDEEDKFNYEIWVCASGV